MATTLETEIVTGTPAPRRVKMKKLDADVDFWASWQRQQANVPSLTDEVETELAKYLAAPCQPRASDPLTWWSDNMAWFFLLSDAARCY